MDIFKLLVVGAACVGAAACHGAEASIGEACPADLQGRIDRPTVTLRIADSTRLQASALGCGGTVALTSSWVWFTKDSSFVRVDASSGWVYGVRAGVSEIVATSRPPYLVSVLSTITVVP